MANADEINLPDNLPPEELQFTKSLPLVLDNDCKTLKTSCLTITSFP